MKTLIKGMFFLSIAFLYLLPNYMIGQTRDTVPVIVPNTNIDFVNPMLIPPLITTPDYHLVVQDTVHNFNLFGTGKLNRNIATMAFNDTDNRVMTVLGPSISWQFGNQINAQVSNELERVTTTHWHGAHVPPHADGGPHQRIQPGTTWTPSFEVKDKSATMWYHPHAMDLTYEQVQMGLSGMIYVEDPIGEDPVLSSIHEILPTEYGVNDFPIIIQTKQFLQDTGNDSIWINNGFGYKNKYVHLVNGRVDPYLVVPPSMIRLRILNGDGKFAFNLGIGNANLDPNYFQLIATDAGYTDRSYEMTEILMAPGERTEWLVDLRGYNEGDTLFIYNKLSEIPPGVIGSSAHGNDGQDRLLLKLIVGSNSGPLSPIIAFPIPLHPSEAPPMDEVTNHRVKTFYRNLVVCDTTYLDDNQMEIDSIDCTSKKHYNIDQTLMDMMVVNDVVKMDSTEIWTIDNTSDVAHPWHIHDIHFWVTQVVLPSGDIINRNNFPDSLISIFAGPKDNVLVQPGWKLSYIATFADFGTPIHPSNSYMYHCHILPHEDKGMMGQFVVWDGSDTNVATKELEENIPKMNVYPNPTDGLLYLEGDSQAKSLVRVTDIRGQVLRELQVAPFSGAISLNLENMPTGIVFVQWFTDKGRAVRKVILK